MMIVKFYACLSDLSNCMLFYYIITVTIISSMTILNFITIKMMKNTAA